VTVPKLADLDMKSVLDQQVSMEGPGVSFLFFFFPTARAAG